MCPAIVEYSQEFQDKVADELKAKGKTSQEIRELLQDYMKLRKACRSLLQD